MSNRKYNLEKEYDAGCWVSLEGLYYVSLIGGNRNLPTMGTASNPRTWDGGYTKSEMDSMTCKTESCGLPSYTNMQLPTCSEEPEREIKYVIISSDDVCEVANESCETPIDSCDSGGCDSNDDDSICSLVKEHTYCKPCGTPILYKYHECVSLCQKIGNESKMVIYRVVAINGTTDDPFEGSIKTPRTWEARTFCQFMNDALKPVELVCEDIQKVFADNGGYVGG